MKKLSLCSMFIFPLLLISCANPEEYKEIDSFSKMSKFNSLDLRRVEDKVLTVNEVDDLLSVFYDESNFDATSIVTVNQAIQSTGITQLTLVSGDLNITNSSIDEIREVISESKGTFELSIENLSMSLPAKTSLQNFIENVMQFSNGNYNSMIISIEQYESTVQGNTSYSLVDKDMILTTSLIAKTSLFYERKRKDKDWEMSVGNKEDDFIPTDDLTFKIVRMSLLAGTIENNF
ncbi:hypothetical protein SGQ83_00605 [Flavobacterium sp. Fl-318]|uniref:Uncharacterized protein n=1 Tax=Flavobacterium cupriresistens TaxID=2893885 RepID=A0ABU4R5H4_9FLAO|nr:MULTISPECIES: hypothetical protein [unclassified Flavobacterium]MDX6187837.1 hypothetical protein [Flavobacterium sp. Fl-318]UFH42242.1 hypothetical protein LNP23_20845 [Flavobacterium sp. F-323]